MAEKTARRSAVHSGGHWAAMKVSLKEFQLVGSKASLKVDSLADWMVHWMVDSTADLKALPLVMWVKMKVGKKVAPTVDHSADQ